MRIDPGNPPKFYFIQVQSGGTDLAQETSYLDFAAGASVTLDAANNAARVTVSYTTLGFTTPVGNTGKWLRSDGTNWVASTPTLANAAGSAGQWLRSDGTNFVLSTATIPATATGTGTILRADGTNWVATTATYPNTIIANNILHATGTNAVGSTSTFNFDGTRVGLGITTASSASRFHISVEGNAVASSLVTTDYFLLSGANTAPAITIVSADNTGNAGARGVFKAVRARGTLAVPLVPISGDNVFSLLGTIFDGSTGLATASIDMEVDGAVSAGVAPQRIVFKTTATTGRTEKWRIEAGGNLSNTGAAGTAYITLKAGTTALGPLQFTSGTSVTTPVACLMECTTDDLFFTITTGPARKRVLMADPSGGLTSGRVPFATTNGRLTDDADMTFATDTLTVTKISTTQVTNSGLTSGRIVIAGTGGLLQDDADLTFATDTLTATKIVGTTSVKVGTAAGFISSDGSTGATGTFTTADAKTVTVKDGIITAIV